MTDAATNDNERWLEIDMWWGWMPEDDRYLMMMDNCRWWMTEDDGWRMIMDYDDDK